MNRLLERAKKLPAPGAVADLPSHSSSTDDNFTAICTEFLACCHKAMVTPQFWTAQRNAYVEILNKAVTVKDIYLLMQAHQLYSDSMFITQKAAIKGDLHSIRVVAGGILGGAIKASDSAVSWALQALSYIETKGLPDLEKQIQSGLYFDDENTTVEKIKAGLSRARARIIGLDKGELIPAVGTARFELMKHAILNKLLSENPLGAEPFCLLDEPEKLGAIPFNFIYSASSCSMPSTSGTPAIEVSAPDVSSSVFPEPVILSPKMSPRRDQFFAPAQRGEILSPQSDDDKPLFRGCSIL